MWQYTSQGTVAGISKKTDVNIAYFGYTQEARAKDETPAQAVVANPEVGIIFTEVNETVTETTDMDRELQKIQKEGELIDEELKGLLVDAKL